MRYLQALRESYYPESWKKKAVLGALSASGLILSLHYDVADRVLHHPVTQEFINKAKELSRGSGDDPHYAAGMHADMLVHRPSYYEQGGF